MPWNSWRRTAVLLGDGLIAVAGYWLALLLRFDGHIGENYLASLPALATLLGGYRVLTSLLFRLHRWSFRFSSLADGARVGMSAASATGLFLATLYLLRHPGPPRSVVVLELLMSVLAMALVRFSPRLAGQYVVDWRRSRSDGSRRTLIVGAGAAGEMLLRDLQRDADHAYHVVGFVDDDPDKRHQVLSGKSVLGTVDQLREIAKRHRVAQILIAIPQLAPRRIREILSLSADLKLRFKIMPVSWAHLQERTASDAMQDLSPEDLLQREPVTFAELPSGTDLAGRCALVTGAAGSIGSEICEQLLQARLATLVMVDLDENGLYLHGRRLARERPAARIELEVADIREPSRIDALFDRYRPHDVFHAAAHKHVPLMETAPGEAIKNNVLGTRHVAFAAHRFRAERFLYVSTDKAVRPTSVMGATKRVGEELVRHLARRSRTRFTAVRFGNVLGSAGSVVPLFRDQIAAGGPVSVTHPDVRRYFMTIPEAVALVLQSAYGGYGELCVLDMGEQIRIVDLARHMITMSGLVPDVDIPIVFVGLRPGEKLSEELLTEDEERTRRVDRKILVADCPPPAPDLERRIAVMGEAAAREELERALEVLRELVPSHEPPLEPSRAADVVPDAGEERAS
jgi:FlaA1/EpsC-like NDP-sugar epimerase